jgi:hypothetical protein
MRQSPRPLVRALLLLPVLAIGVAGCGASGPGSTHAGTTHFTSGFGVTQNRISKHLLRPVIIKGYEQGGATPAQAREVADCVIPILAKHGITGVVQLQTSSDTSLPRTATAACKKKLGIK